MPALEKGLLSGLTVIDFGSGLAGGLAADMLRRLGGTIIRAEPKSGDPFYDVYPIYKLWRNDENVVRASCPAAAVEALADQLARADICVVGGEDYPGYDWLPDAEALELRFPQLVILQLTPAPGTAAAAKPAVELLAQARTGLVFEQFDERPSVFSFQAGAYGAALQGLTGVAAALFERERSGLGQIVRTSLEEGIRSWLTHDWFHFETPTEVANDRTPKGARPLIFRCADDDYIHIILAATDARKHLYTLLSVENPVPSLEDDPRGMPSVKRGTQNYFGDVDVLRPYIATWRRRELLDALWRVGVAPEAVNPPGEAWDDDQVVCNELIAIEPDGSRRVGSPFSCAATYREDSSPPPSVGACVNDGAPLRGVRVVDLGAFTAGPHASLALRDLGADVVKVETLAGDVMRFYFLKYTASNRGKRVIAVDLKNPDGMVVLRRALAGADIVQHNFRPGAARRLGVDAKTLHDFDPDQIVLDVSAYGYQGPKAAQGGFDMVFHSLCGHSVVGAGVGREPRNYRLPVVDFAAGVIGSMLSGFALYARLRGAHRLSISTNLMNCGFYLLSELVQKPSGEFIPLPQLDREELGTHPALRLYRAGDDWIAIAALNDPMSRGLLEVLELNERIKSPRASWGEAEARAIQDAINNLTLSALVRLLTRANVWFAVADREAKSATLADPQLMERGAVVQAGHQTHGMFRQLGLQFSLSRSPVTPRGDSPERGEDTCLLLSELGYSDAEIEHLYRIDAVA